VRLNVESRYYAESICSRDLIELLSKTQDEDWDFFEKLAWKTYAFEQANETFRYLTHGKYDFHANPYPPGHFMNSYDPSYSCMHPILCDYCESSDHDAHTYPYRAYVDATRTSFEKKFSEMTDQMIETMNARNATCSQCFNQNRETYSDFDSSLGSPKHDINLYDDFEPSYSARPDLNEDMYLPSLDQESDLHMSLSPELAPRTNSPKGITNDVLVVPTYPPL